MLKTIISDTSCFIVLSKTGQLDLHQLFGNIVTTPEIAEEFGEKLPNWVKIVAAKDIHKRHLFEIQVDKGEASAMALALETMKWYITNTKYRHTILSIVSANALPHNVCATAKY
jgi:predicted nucleic acid-binding protein